MDLEQEVKSLKQELDQYKTFVESLNAEKMSLDQSFVEQLKSSLVVRKDLILANSKVEKLTSENNQLTSEVNKLRCEVESLKNQTKEEK